MKLIKNTVNFNLKNTAVALGKFDGIHLGHRRILQEITHAKEEGYITVIFTFSVPPASLLRGEKESLLLTEEEKVSLYEQMGVDVLIIYPVSREFLSMEPESFLEDILCEKLGMKLLIGGDDLHFGRNRRGDAALAVSMAGELGYQVKIVQKEKFTDDEVIGSTRIRECLQRGEIEQANRMLGYPYFFTGPIAHGKAVGRTLGFPTINLKVQPCKLLPAYGVYASETVLEGETYQSITNIGIRPTVSDTMEPSVETYLFGFDRDVYGEKATVRLLKFMRPEMKFAGVEELRGQIEKDKEERIHYDI